MALALNRNEGAWEKFCSHATVASDMSGSSSNAKSSPFRGVVTGTRFMYRLMHADADRVSRGLGCRIFRNEQHVSYVPPTVREQSGREAQGLG